MTHFPVSTGIPAIVMRKRSHVVNMVDERSMELVRRVPYVVVFVAMVIAELAYVGSPPFAGLGNRLGYGAIADGTLFVLAVSMLIIGRRIRLDREQMAEAGVVFLPEWTYAMLLSVVTALVLLLA